MLGGREGLHEAQTEGYQRLLRLAQEHGIQVCFLETPKYVRMYQDEDYMELYRACIQQMEEFSGEAFVVLAEDLDFDRENPECFQDLIHLSTQGRTLYTKLLCDQLKQGI